MMQPIVIINATYKDISAQSKAADETEWSTLYTRNIDVKYRVGDGPVEEKRFQGVHQELGKAKDKAAMYLAGWLLFHFSAGDTSATEGDE